MTRAILTQTPAQRLPAGRARLSALPTRQQTFAAAVSAVVANHREVAAAEARLADSVEVARLAGIALCSKDSFTGGPQWSSEMIVERQLITELAVALHLSEGDARRLIVTSAGLAAAFDATRETLETGRISFRHAEKIVQHSLTLPPECIDAYEAHLLPLARTVTVQKLDRLARGAAEEAQPKTAIQRHVDAAANRRLYLDPASDGMAYLTHYLPAVEAVAIFNRSTDLAKSAKSAGDARTLTQLRVDTLSDLLLNGETSIPTVSRGIRARITVTVPVLTLLGRDFSHDLKHDLPRAPRNNPPRDVPHDVPDGLPHDLPRDPLGDLPHDPLGDLPRTLPHDPLDDLPHDPPHVLHRAAWPPRVSDPSPRAPLSGAAQLEGYGPIDRHTALMLTRDAPSFGRVLTDPVSGRTLSYGRERYKPPAELDDLVRQTHRECTFPLCGAPSASADLDHTVAWSDGGETAYANLSPLCSSHHKVKHHTEWLVEQSPEGTITWTSPAGFAYIVEPTPLAKPAPQFSDEPPRHRRNDCTSESESEPEPEPEPEPESEPETREPAPF